MLTDFYATKTGMTQAWTADGKRLAVTRLRAQDNIVTAVLSPNILEVGYGQKKEKNITKPLLQRYKKSGFSFYPAQLGGVRWQADEGESQPAIGSKVSVESVFSVGDVVEVRGTSKGRGFAGAVKRYGFRGGPKTHGQSDRTRAVGSIGAGTTPGRVWKGKRMPGHYGVETKTVSGLVVIHVDPKQDEIWVSGPVPGHLNAAVLIRKTGKEKPLALNLQASGLPQPEQTKTSTDDSQAEKADIAEKKSSAATQSSEVITPTEPKAQNTDDLDKEKPVSTESESGDEQS